MAKAKGVQSETLGNESGGASALSEIASPLLLESSDSGVLAPELVPSPDISSEHGLPDEGGAADPVAEEYAVPSWAEFRTFVMENGNKYVRASYPDSPADLIETIWCGVPVIAHEQARVMTPKGEWLVY